METMKSFDSGLIVVCVVIRKNLSNSIYLCGIKTPVKVLFYIQNILIFFSFLHKNIGCTGTP